MNEQRIPLNTLAIPFGLAGLATVWTVASDELALPSEIGAALLALTAASWVTLLTVHTVRGSRSQDSLHTQLRNPVQGPIAALVPIVGMILGAGLYRIQPTAGQVVVIVFVVIAATFAGWLTAGWMAGNIPAGSIHGGYYLPTVASGLIASTTAAETDMTPLAVGAFAIGTFMWIVVTVILLTRLMLGPALPNPLVPTLAIFVAPPAVAGAAWHLIDRSVGPVDYALAGLTVFMLVIQLALLPRYLALPFSLGFWSFTFPYAAVGGYGIQWLGILQPAGWQPAIIAIAAAITVLVGAVALKSSGLLRHGDHGSKPRPLTITSSAPQQEVEVH